MQQSATPEKWDYRLIISPRKGLEPAKITYYSEMIEGQTYGYDAMIDWCKYAQEQHPSHSHCVQKRVNFDNQ